MAEVDRITVLVIDSGGVGEMPDAAQYGDTGANTLGNVAAWVGGLAAPTLGRLGFGRLTDIAGLPAEDGPRASYGRLSEASPGKDTTTGHWEMSGIILDKALPVFPNGFPEEIIARFRERTGLDVLGNKPASGTVIIQELGEEHQATGKPIVYTSADSVFQIAAHTDVIPLPRLYEICEIARRIADEYGISRVIARPFTGHPGAYTRTKDRRDYALPPPSRMVLNNLADVGVPVIGVGKIRDIFNGEGISDSIHAKDNQSIGDATIELLKKTPRGFIFSNFVDFDMLYGHRNDPDGYARALEAFDAQVATMLSHLTDRDLLIITADHGCDPTIKTSTDHTREYVPLIVYAPRRSGGTDLGIRDTFADIGQTLADALGAEPIAHGKSFLSDVI